MFQEGAGLHSLSCNGTNAYVAVPNSASLDISGAITVEAWVKTNVNGAFFNRVVSRYSETGGGYILDLYQNKVRFWVLQNVNSYDFITGGTTLQPNAWYHIAGVSDGTQMRVYLDGVLNGLQATTKAPGAGTTRLFIGARGNDAAAGFFDGLIDEARISAAALYSTNFTPCANLTPGSGTAGFWRFDDKKISDASGNGNVGVLNGGANFVADAPPQSSSALVSYWKLDESGGATTTDATGNGNTGTVQGAARSNGIFGRAQDFNGTNNYVSVASNASLTNVTNNFTRAFWASPRSTHEIDPESTTIVSGTSGQRYVFGPTWFDPGTASAGAGVSVGTNGVSVYEHSSSFMPAKLVYQAPITGWTHIAVVYENRQPKLYINGVLVRTGLTSPQSYVHINPWNLGGTSYGSSDLDGTITSYAWNFGDNTTGTGVSPTHTYVQRLADAGERGRIRGQLPDHSLGQRDHRQLDRL